MAVRVLFSIVALITLFLTDISAYTAENFFVLAEEPKIRIGLLTNASSVSITTSDTSLVALSPGESARFLASDRVVVSARSYRPPEIENYRIEFQNLPTQPEAADLANDIREATDESAIASIDAATRTWKVWVGKTFDSTIDAENLKARLAEKGFADSVTVTEKKTLVTAEAQALSQQLRAAGKSEVRSLTQKTVISNPNVTGPIDPNLREVIVNGASAAAKYSSLKSVAFGSVNERANPVKLNGKAYRGRLEVFVNSRGTLTVVNEVPLEDYLLGVVPAELGLPQLEAQKAQAVAARTYAMANVGGYGTKGFDMVPTVWSQVYKGVSIETAMGTRAVRETRGLIATYDGKPITAYYTSTCGGRTEDGSNIFDGNEPYLRGVECSLEGTKHFETFQIKTSRQPARLREEGSLELAQFMARLSVNGYQLTAPQLTDNWFEDAPGDGELTNWINQLASRFGRPFPQVTKDSAKPLEFARILSGFLYPAGFADAMLSEADINYHLSFDDAGEIPKDRRADVAALIRDGYFAIHPDLTLKPNKHFTRAKILRILRQIYDKKKWTPALQTGIANPAAAGRLFIKTGRTQRELAVRGDVFLFREFGTAMHGVREVTLVGGEEVAFQTDASGAVAYLEVRPVTTPTTAERMSPWVYWNKSASASAVQSRLSRYVRGIGTLYDVNIKRVGYSRRPVELEIIGSNGVKTLKGGKIRSALRLPEQLFVMNKSYSGNRVTNFTFTGRGWGHGVGMCQYGAFGLAKQGVKYDEIIKHYYTGVDLTRAY